MSVIISSSEQKFIFDGCRENCRQDGRARQEYRSYSTVSGASSTSSSEQADDHPPLALSNGSARVFLATGETHLLVSVKAELVVPAMSHPSSGVLDIHVDFMHDKDETLGSTISNLLLPHLVDLERLCVVPNYYVWRLAIDVLVIASNGGSLLDACSRGIHAAIQTTLLPKLTHEAAPDGGKPVLQIDSDIKNAYRIPGSDKAPVIATISLLKTSTEAKTTPVFILDATKEEEACAFAQVRVVLDRSSEEEPIICALHKAGGGSLPLGLLQDVTSFVLQSFSQHDKLFSNDGHQHMLQETFVIQ
jgi:exosome complex RNA-binding protein Rrp42 (RNase PH superfamily)